MRGHWMCPHRAKHPKNIHRMFISFDLDIVILNNVVKSFDFEPITFIYILNEVYELILTLLKIKSFARIVPKLIEKNSEKNSFYGPRPQHCVDFNHNSAVFRRMKYIIWLVLYPQMRYTSEMWCKTQGHAHRRFTLLLRLYIIITCAKCFPTGVHRGVQ